LIRKLAAVFIAAAAVAAMAGPAAATADRADIFGPNFQWTCDFSSNSGPHTPTGSFAVLKYNKGQNSVGATVQLKGAEPNTTYKVRIIQGFGDCFTDDGTVTTNGQGNGTLTLSEPATTTQAAVGIQSQSTLTFVETDPITHP
jgi:hypothetical protein